MWTNQTYDTIIRFLQQCRFLQAFRLLQNHLLMLHPDMMEPLTSLQSDYQLLNNYWQQGYADPQRDMLYEQLLHRLYTVTANYALTEHARANAVFAASHKRPRQKARDWSLTALRHDLEEYVSDIALLQLEPEHVRSEKSQQLYADHQALMSALFDYIWTSRQWKESLADAFIDMLLSPTIDSADQQLMVSAITLSAMNLFDYQKFRILATVYRQTVDASLRQRSLVGWVFALQDGMQQLFPEMQQLVKELCDDEETLQELTELQMQLVFCTDAENDTETIKKEIMPDLMKGQNLHFTSKGLEELEEDSLQDILHPEAAEQTMEQMEKSINRMIDMQKNGSDIYFAGFSQMKRFSFFYDLSNWFVPFYHEHPGISAIWNAAKSQKFLRVILKMGAFCDSDKYSFVLAFDQVLRQLPQQMIEMIEHGEASPMPVGGEVSLEEQRKPAFVRRLYLQNLYRFFRLSPVKSEFRNPFTKDQGVLFFMNTVFRSTRLDERVIEIASFLTKRQRYSEARQLLLQLTFDQQKPSFFLLLANLHARFSDTDLAAVAYRQVLEHEPENVRALKGMARVEYAKGDYAKALQYYERLHALQPDNRQTQLNTAICLTKATRYEEALQLLYKLNYFDEADENVRRALAWTLTCDGKYDQASRHYERLLALPEPQPSDLLNAGYCRWFSGDIAGALELFRQFKNHPSSEKVSLDEEFTKTEHQLILSKGVSETDILLMLDSL